MRLPVITRSKVQQQGPALHASQIPPFAGRVRDGATSGSTGRPLRYRHEDLLDIASGAQTDRAFTRWGLDGRKALATFMSSYDDLAGREGKQRGGWRYGVPEGTRHILELMIDVDAQLDWLAKIRPDYLFARGGVHITALAERAERRGTRLRFDRILSTGTAIDKSTRGAARRVFKAEIADFYGASETGLIAHQFPDCGFYHTCDETMRVEVLRPDGNPCSDGELGRTVVTPLYGYAMPLIRYEIGDYAIRGPEHAACGRPLGSLRAIVGRYRNVFHLGDGRVLTPYANANGLSAVLSFSQVQIVQVAYDQIEIRYVPASEQPPDEAAIQNFVRTAFDPSLNTVLVPVDHLPASPSGKFEETLSFVGPVEPGHPDTRPQGA
ncbi:hypothetical protein MKK58_18435 [Methylobacterium sp. J-078]|uniref:hypothetical protein n=1 Tax=Methylobacterium sp. J-078 TaxID=2836657 RepID=UPI001FB8CDEA|nr:hypothetical protein [Methylobacterium sp. J-078]MCJ2046496.1 hypothetical protein [Methylobacterium sp. J-078]